MSEYNLRYGQQLIDIDFARHLHPIIIRSKIPLSDKSQTDFIKDILAHPIQSLPLSSFVENVERLALIIPDKTRLCGAHLFLPIILDEINRAGISPEQITIIFANGTHAPQNDDEKRAIVGAEIFSRYRIVDHDARDTSQMIEVGTTSFGTHVQINRVVAEADKIIAIGAIVHHYFAGYGGGAKLVMPGVAGYSTAVQNHKRTLTSTGEFHPNCRDGVTAGNPVYEDIVDALKFYPPIFYFATLLNEDGVICDGVCGDIRAAHEIAMQKVDAYYKVHIGEQADLVIVSTGGYPKDINFIQSHKTIQHGYYATKKNGVLICFAECVDGIGNDSFLDWFRIRNDAAMKQKLLEHYTMNGHTALSLKNKTREIKIILISRLSTADVELMGMIPAENFHDAYTIAKRFIPSDHSTFIIENGAQTIPHLKI